MSSEIVITKKLQFKLNEIAKDKIIKEVITPEASNTRARLKDAINQGQNADGGAIKAGGYSESYKKYRQAKGLGTTVNLQFKSTLLNSMQVKEIKDGAEIFFLGSHYSGISNAQLVSILEQRGFKDWFGLGQVDKQRIEKSFEAWLDKAMDKAIS